MALQGT